MPYEILKTEFGGPLIEKTCPLVFEYGIYLSSVECDFTVNEDPVNDKLISAVFLSGENSKSNNFYGIRYEEFRKARGTWLDATRNIENQKFGASTAFSIDRIINIKSQRSIVDTETYYVTNVFSGRGKQSSNNQVCYFLAYFVTDVYEGKIYQENSGTIYFLNNIFDFNYSALDGSGGDYIDYKKTSLFDISPSDNLGNFISLIYVYRTKNSIPFGISIIVIQPKSLNTISNSNFIGSAEKLVNNKRTLSAWSEKNIYEAINDNTKPIFYIYYDLEAQTLNYVFFRVKVPVDRITPLDFSIDPNFAVIEKQIVFDKTSLGGTPVITIGISGNGKVFTINDNVYCLWEDTNGIFYSNKIVTLGFSPGTVSSTYNFFIDTSPIISTTGKYIIGVDYESCSCVGDTSFPCAQAIKGYSYNKITGTYDFTGEINISTIDDNNLVIMRSNIGFRDSVFDPSKSAVENDLWLKFWSAPPTITDNPYFGVINFKKSDLNLPADDDSNFLEGPSIRDPATIKAILEKNN